MITNEQLIRVLDNISTAVGVASPVYDDNNKIVDFTVEYVNKSFCVLTRNLFKPGMQFSAFKGMISQEVDWAEMTASIIGDESISEEKTFYSILFNCWLRVRMNSVFNSYVAITLTDVSLYKESEQRLRRQNLRLASLTDELNLSRADLRNKLASIQVLNEQLLVAAYHDTLTNLNNRAMYNKCITEAISHADSSRGKIGLMIMDIDNIKNINDSQGHHAGDDVIQGVARVLRKFENENITAFRFSGDDFIVLYQNIDSRDQVMELGEQILERCNSKGIFVSGGISIYPEDSAVAEDLLKFADMAKSEVKKNGKNNVFVFHSIMQEKFLAKMNIENKLSKATADEIFQLYFQPQFDVASNKLRGFEALLRWHDDELGWISPEQFIPLAEETRLVIPIGDWVIDTGIATIAKWEKQFNFDSIISINVSPVQFKKADFMEKLLSKIEKYGINTKHLEIEITEGILIDNVEETVKKLQVLRDMGIGISLDDFGTGYSSLRYLQMLPLTTLKIDKSFINNISAEGAVEASITESIVSLVSKMGLDTIAEGVETASQLEVLKRMNCQSIQGFLKGKPMPISVCERVLSGDESALDAIERSSLKG